MILIEQKFIPSIIYEGLVHAASILGREEKGGLGIVFDPRSIAPRVHARFPCSGSAMRYRSQHSGRSGRHLLLCFDVIGGLAKPRTPLWCCRGSHRSSDRWWRLFYLGPFWTLASCPQPSLDSRPLFARREGLVSTVCACATYYPESG